MIVYKDKSYCFTKNCIHFNKECDKKVIANEELLTEAHEYGLPVEARTFELDSDNRPVDCIIFDREYCGES